MIQSVQNSQISSTEESTSKSVYNQFATQAMNTDQQKSQNIFLRNIQMLFVKTQSDAQSDVHIRFLNTLMSMKKAYEISDSVIAKEIRTNLSKNTN